MVIILQYTKNGKRKESQSASAERIKIFLKFFLLDERSVRYDENHWDCHEMMIAIGNALFNIKSQRVAENQHDFYFEEISAYRQEIRPYVISAGKEETIHFIRIEREPESDAVMRLSIGNRPILITARLGDHKI